MKLVGSGDLYLDYFMKYLFYRKERYDIRNKHTGDCVKACAGQTWHEIAKDRGESGRKKGAFAQHRETHKAGKKEICSWLGNSLSGLWRI